MADTNPSASQPSRVAVRDYIEAIIEVSGVDSPKREEAIHSALGQLRGVEEVIVRLGKIFVRYDPVSVSKGQLNEAMRAAGFDIVAEETAPCFSADRCSKDNGARAEADAHGVSGSRSSGD